MSESLDDARILRARRTFLDQLHHGLSHAIALVLGGPQRDVVPAQLIAQARLLAALARELRRVGQLEGVEGVERREDAGLELRGAVRVGLELELERGDLRGRERGGV